MTVSKVKNKSKRNTGELGNLFFDRYLVKNDSITWAIMLVLFPLKKHKK
ncbi:MAG: hypothetical protein ACI9XO_001572 [Paraglaciecola sp.]|jgi:hypothetical protein